MEKILQYILAYAAVVVAMPRFAEQSSSISTDEAALVSFKAHINSDPNLILARNWTNSTTSICSWFGVTCSSRHNRVTALSLPNMNLSGTISPQLGNLSFLVSLDLRFNFFTGTLPQELARLRRLKRLSLAFNDLTGEIPSWFSYLHRLEYLHIQNNSFTGFIPASLSNLSSLQYLNFASNPLQGGIPEELATLGSLQFLIMETDNLSGTIPPTIFNMSTLKIIAFSQNELRGGLPLDLCRNLPFLEKIYLSLNHLSGQIPSSLHQCSQLQLLSLSYNSFSGQIPAQLGQLEYLQYLNIGGNDLTGVIPQEIGNLLNLVEFGIEISQITGAIPLNIWNLTQLRHLNLHSNSLTGIIPREIGQLHRLEKLSLGSNYLNGSVPFELFNISTLRRVSFTSNGLSGTLPNNLCYRLTSLDTFNADANYLTGEIPKTMSNCSNLRVLTLGNNDFTGFVPHSLGNLRLLTLLSLGGNNLTTESSELSFITTLTNCRFLTVLTIFHNPLDGVIPTSIGNFSSLQQLLASNCKIKGGIPAEIGNSSSLVFLALPNNELSGNIPSTVKHLDKLQGLVLHNNSITGSVPEGLCQLPSLFKIFLSQNQLTGSIPECLGNATFLRYLHLDSNMLNSTIPSSLWGIKDLLGLDLSSNSLTGFLPSEMGNLAAVIYINLSMNQLSESIPITIGNLKTLTNLSLSHNRFQGSIPVSVGVMISLVSLDLSHNHLSGSIPKSLESLQLLEYFNVSSNALSGEIPNGGPFRNFTAESFRTNEALCGIPRFNVPLCPAVSSNNSNRRKVKIAFSVVGGVIGLTMIIILAFIFRRYKMKVKAPSGNDGLQVATVPERISYYEILQATEEFNETNLLGIGSLGSVYKAVLRNGKTFAIKVFNLQLEAAFRSFDVECEVLRSIRHRNLIKVISTCSNQDFKALVLEYMPKGSLEKWLYSHNYCLDIMQRLNIMIDVASALEYLHHGYSTPIVHCDVKPSNVLLDEEMTAHVGDFGISKLLGDGVSHVLTNTLATLGYIAPEYGLEGLLSTRSDVYSYGIMLMETFTRRRPSDDMFAGDLSLKSWVESSVPQSTHEVIDANLFTNVADQHLDKSLQCATSVLELGLKCSSESPRERINMKEAMAELLKIKHRFSTRN